MSQRADSGLIGSLAERYRVVGELRAPSGARRFVAMRRGADGEVVIDIVKSPGGLANELAHLAADVQLLTTMSHPKVPTVVEGRWLDANTYAAVSERIKGDTLQERLDRGDRPGTAEVATMLNDVKAVLDWAREGGIVHRGVSPESIIIESDTNRLLVSLGPTRIPLSGIPGEVADTRTIGALAWSMFTGRRFVGGEARPPLKDLCPNLAARVVDATERILDARPGERAPDAAAFIGIVAVGDVLKQAEVEFAALDEEFASQFAGDASRQAPVHPEALLDDRPSRVRESVFAIGTIAALVLSIALGVALAGRGRGAGQPIVAQQMPTVPAAASVDSGASPMRNDSILTRSAGGSLADSLLLLRFRDSLVRDSIIRDRAGRERLVGDSLGRDSTSRDSLRRDSLEEDSFRRDSIRNAIRDLIRRDSVRRDSLRRGLLRLDTLRRRDSTRPDTLP